jgi:hypothetical protein
MINKKHIDEIKIILGSLIDEIADMQSAVNDDRVGPEEIRDFYAALDYAEYKTAGIMYGANVEIDGAYNEDE